MMINGYIHRCVSLLNDNIKQFLFTTTTEVPVAQVLFEIGTATYLGLEIDMYEVPSGSLVLVSRLQGDHADRSWKEVTHRGMAN